jgi:hypothetical protein
VITAIVPVSPIRSHPDTAILTETLGSIRHHLPDAEIVLTFDGVRPEQSDRRADYEEHIRRALWLADHHYRNVVPFVWNEHLHQVGMLRRVLDEIRTPLLLFVEQDTPLTDDLIDWNACIDLIMSGEADLVRYSHEAEVLPPHRHMTIGEVENGFQRTCQFSARPHLASVAYYRRILDAHFSPEARTYTEDVMHGVCHQAYTVDGMRGWYQHRIWIFHPEGNIRRSYHTDGRAGEPKYEDQLVF